MLFIRKQLKAKRKETEIEPQEIFLDALVKREHEEYSTWQLEVPLTKRTIVIFGFIILFLFSLIFFRVIEIQILSHHKFLALAQKNQFFYKFIQYQRGVIYDRNLNQLVFNKPSFDLVCKKDEIIKIGDWEKIVKNLSALLGFEERKVLEKINQSKKNEVIIAEDLDYQTLIRFEGLSENFPGFYIRNQTQREYKDGIIFAHILGYYRKSGQNAGLEAFYDDILKSQPGKIIVERDAQGEVISEKIEEFPKPGKSLVLWIDKSLQEKLYYELQQKLKELGITKGAAVAIDPNTGGVLALVSIPSYNNNLFAQGITEEQWERIQNDKNYPLLNRVIGGRYPTGSTIKPLIAAAALQEGIISPKTRINCQGKIIIENPWFKDKPFIYRDWKVHGITDVKKAIAESCNVFFYIVGGGYKGFKGLGVELIKKYLKLFGWGEKTNIDLPGEQEGFIPDREWKKNRFSTPNNIWFPGDTYNLSIGQGYLRITPLEVAASFVAIANGGKLLKPQVVKAIIDEKKRIAKEFPPKVIRERFIDKKNLEIVRKGMREAVIYGSATILNDLPVEAAAKTGTAELAKKDRYHNWVTVFAPYENPQIVLTIIVEEVKGMHLAALPVAKGVLSWYFSRKDTSEKASQR
jgi:penicillin-binding protein 2